MSSVDVERSLEHEYLTHISRQWETLEFARLVGSRRAGGARLQQLYVGQRLCWERCAEASADLLEVVRDHPRLMILGEAGSGKSVLIRALAFGLSTMDSDTYRRVIGPYIPFPLLLRDHPVGDWQDIDDLLRALYGTLHPEVQMLISIGWLKDRLLDGRAILLLDGMDEVSSNAVREYLRDRILCPLIEVSDGRLRVVATSRIVGYHDAPLELCPGDRVAAGTQDGDQKNSLVRFRTPKSGYRTAYLAPLAVNIADHFVDRWYRCVEQDPVRSDSAIQEVQTALRSTLLGRLGSNPLMLTLLLLVHRVYKELPSIRCELYDGLLNACLWTIPTQRGLHVFEATRQEMRSWLNQAGYALQERRSRMADVRYNSTMDGSVAVSRQELVEIFRTAMSPRRDPALDDADRFVDYLAGGAGLLIERGPGRYTFIHPSIQEFCAGCRIVESAGTPDDLYAEVRAVVLDLEWRETLVLACERLAHQPGAADSLVGRLIQAAARPQSDYAAALSHLIMEVVNRGQSGLSLGVRQAAIEFCLTTASWGVLGEWHGSSIEALVQRLSSERWPHAAAWFGRALTGVRAGEEPPLLPWVGLDILGASGKKAGISTWLAGWAAGDHSEQAHSYGWKLSLASIAGSQPEVAGWLADHCSTQEWLLRPGLQSIGVRSLPGLTIDSGCPTQARREFLRQLAAVQELLLIPDISIPATISSSGRDLSEELLQDLMRVAEMNIAAALTREMDVGSARVWEIPRARELASDLARGLEPAPALALDLVQDLRLARKLTLALALFLDLDLVQAREAVLELALNLDLVRNMAVELDLARVHDMSETLARDLALALDSSPGLSSGAARPRPSPAVDMRLVTAEWLGGAASHPSRAAEDLLSLAGAATLWERLQGHLGSIVMGRAGPELVSEVNRTLDHAWTPADFPEEIRGEATEMLALHPGFVVDLFLRDPGNIWLEPAWFDSAHRNDPDHPAYLFRAPAHQYWPRFCEVVDPHGVYNLAAHLLPSPIQARQRAEAREAAS